MNKQKSVVRLERKTSTTERVVKAKTTTYKNGSVAVEETIFRRTVTQDFALLECGHWARDWGKDIRERKRFTCYQCENPPHKNDGESPADAAGHDVG